FPAYACCAKRHCRRFVRAYQTPMDARPAPETVNDDASKAAIPTLLGVMFVNMVGFGIVVPLLPFAPRSSAAPAGQRALFFSPLAPGAFLGEPFWGRMSDRLGRKPI